MLTTPSRSNSSSTRQASNNGAGSIANSVTAEPSANNSSNSAANNGSSTQTGTLRTIVQSIPPESCGNCTFDIPWTELATVFPTLSSLENASEVVVVANVTSLWTVSRSGVPVTLYNITVITVLKNFAVKVTPDQVITMGEIGGSNQNETFTLGGYPTLIAGSTYVLFLSTTGGAYEPNGEHVGPAAPFTDYVSSSSFFTFMTEGGPQGLFYVQRGNAYSRDNMYPQADAWIRTKVPGIPLAQFIQEVQAATVSSTSVP
jgi:hypothetical protein